MLQTEILSKLNGFDVKKIVVEGQVLKLQILLKPGDNADFQETIIKNIFPNYEVHIMFIMQDVQKKKFKKIIGVSSGKGGVGKSTVTLHMAFALKEKGYRVGILDADIYAPSIPVFLNAKGQPGSSDGRLIDPIKTDHGFQMLSMGLFLQDNQSAMWRGPMLASAFAQFLEQGNWDCDYLLIDFPPGTSDIHMSCAKVAPDIEMLLVGTPERVVYADVMRMYVVLRSLGLKVVGLIENMSCYKCTACGYVENIETTSAIKEVQKLEKLPIFHQFHKLAESGYPADYAQTEEAEYFGKLVSLVE